MVKPTSLHWAVQLVRAFLGYYKLPYVLIHPLDVAQAVAQAELLRDLPGFWLFCICLWHVGSNSESY